MTCCFLLSWSACRSHIVQARHFSFSPGVYLEWRLAYEECEGATNARWLRARRNVLGCALALYIQQRRCQQQDTGLCQVAWYTTGSYVVCCPEQGLDDQPASMACALRPVKATKARLNGLGKGKGVNGVDDMADLGGLVRRVVDLEVEGLFRSVVGFL